MTQRAAITVRRAKPGDADRITEFVNRAWQGRKIIDQVAVFDRFGDVGFLLAERDDVLLGMLGWQAENLVVRLTDFLVGSTSERMAVSQALLAEMEQAADDIQCEVVLLFLPRPAPQVLVEFYQTLGYKPRIVSELPRAWHEAALEGGLGEEETVLVKKLREKRVLRPI